jgi:PIN domain nuclease of toxin-antitoxin system
LRLLLDTHIVLWCLEDSPRLTQRARDLVTDPDNEVLVSAASLWEIAIKHALGRLQLDLATLEPGLRRTGFDPLPITGSHALAVANLPEHHRDPFARSLAAQSIAEGLRLVTHDTALVPYGTAILV